MTLLPSPWPRVATTFGVVVALAGTGSASAADPPDPALQKAGVCAACHGEEGRSTTADVPSLAGQPKQFVTTQLVMFREGNRKNPIMNGIAASMSNADISALGSYFASRQPQPAGKAMVPDTAAAARGTAEKLGCVTCHGAELRGQQHIPRLAGQHAEYLRTQLAGFKAGTRFDMDGNMTAAAQALTPADIDLLANYLSTLR